MLTEFLPDDGPAPAAVWNRIDQQIQRERICLSRPLFWQGTSAVLALAVLALLILTLC